MRDYDDDKTHIHVVLTKGTMVCHYRIVEKIGAGGMGEVYLAEDTKLSRRVALKFLPTHFSNEPELRARFMREAEATAKLNHSNIVTIYEVSEFHGRPFFSMELVEGRSLSDLIDSMSIDLAEVLSLADQVGQGLVAAHRGNVVHRDVKPSNVIVNDNNSVKILDFGLAAIQGGEQLTQVGSTMGTINYMSPEQIDGKQVDQRSDIFSFGVMLYEMVTGQTPFRRNSNAATFKAISQEKQDPLSRFRRDIPDGLQRLVDKLLEKNCETRYQDMESVLIDLRRINSVDNLQISEKPTIAILPFNNLSTDQEQEFFCDGIAEDILNDLARIQDLRVVSRTSSFAFKKTKKDLRDVGRELQADSILEGSVRKSGNRIRITVQLIKASDGYHLWSEKYDKKLDDIFAIQDEISLSIVRALKIRLDPKQASRSHEAPTRSVEAYELYLRGREFLYRSGPKGNQFAIELFSRAIENDPEYALAYSGLADSLSQIYMYFDQVRPNIDGAMDASRKALELDPHLAEAHSSRGLALSLDKQYDLAEIEFEKAIELNPSLFEASYQYARVCFVQGKYEKACELFERASKVKPEDYQALLLSARLYEKLGQKEKAEETSLKGLAAAKKHLELTPNDVRAVYLSAGAFADIGRVKEAKEWAEKAASMEPDDPAVLYNIACLFASLAEPDQAMAYLKQAVKCGYSAKVWIESDPDLDSIRKHPDYEPLLRNMSG